MSTADFLATTGKRGLKKQFEPLVCACTAKKLHL
jgi:hypothetical protein